MDLTVRYIDWSRGMHVQKSEAPSVPLFHCDPFSDLEAWHFYEALTGASLFCQSLHLPARHFSIIQSHTTNMHIQHSHMHAVQYSTTQKMLHSNVKKLFKWKKRPLNWRAIFQPPGTFFLLLFCAEQKVRCVCVCVRQSGNASAGSEGQEHQGCDDCFAVHML